MNDPIVVAGAGEAAAEPDPQILADEMEQAIGLDSAPVAVSLLAPGADMAPFAGWETVERHRYCQALMKARAGERVILEAAETVVGFPGARLAQLVDSLAFLSEQAVPRSRAKRAHQALVTGCAEKPGEPSPFDGRAE